MKNDLNEGMIKECQHYRLFFPSNINITYHIILFLNNFLCSYNKNVLNFIYDNLFFFFLIKLVQRL